MHATHHDRRSGGQRCVGIGAGARVPRRRRCAGSLPRIDAVGVFHRGRLAAGFVTRLRRARIARHRYSIDQLIARAGGGRAVATPTPHLQHRGRHPSRRRVGRRPQVVLAHLPGVLRAPSTRTRGRRARHHPHRRDNGPVRSRPAVRRSRPARVCAVRRDLRGHVRADSAERGSGIGGRDGAG